MRISAPSALMAFLLAACAHAPALPAGARYVNMGSSFAAGAGVTPSATGSPQRCYQSAANYAHLLAARLNLALSDVSCGGATTAHLLGPWNELPAQLDAVTPDTRLVTITIGGNDVALVGNLTQASCDPGEIIRAGRLSVPCPPAPFPVADVAWETLERNLRDIAHQIAVRAPQARTIFIQYVTLVPGVQCANTRLSAEEATALRATAQRLAAVTARVAAETGVMVLAMDQRSLTHTPCDAAPWSLGLPRNADPAAGAPWHPNAAGMDAIADALQETLAARPSP